MQNSRKSHIHVFCKQTIENELLLLKLVSIRMTKAMVICNKCYRFHDIVSYYTFSIHTLEHYRANIDLPYG